MNDFICDNCGIPSLEDKNVFCEDCMYERKLAIKRSLNPNYEPAKTTYMQIHKWVYKQAGRADHCQENEEHISKRYEWANLSGNYRREMSDWKQLCKECHTKYDNVIERGKKTLMERYGVSTPQAAGKIIKLQNKT